MNREERKAKVYKIALEEFNAQAPAPSSGAVGLTIIKSREFTASPPNWERTPDTLSARDVMEQVWKASEFLFGEVT